MLSTIMTDIPNFDFNNNTSYVAALTLGTLIERVPDSHNNIINDYIHKFINFFKISLDSNNFNNIAIQYEYLGYISSLINTALINNKRSINLSKDHFVSLYSLLIQSFTQRKDIYPEAINCIGSIISCKFNNKINLIIFLKLRLRR